MGTRSNITALARAETLLLILGREEVGEEQG